MVEVWLWLLLFVCVCMVIKGSYYPESIYEPLLPVGVVFIGFVWLQLHGFTTNESVLPQGALSKTVFMSFLCAASFFVGYTRRVKPMEFLSGDYSLKRLFIVSLLLSLFGSFFFFQISRLPEELTASSQWTGLPVAFLFFASTLVYGFAISCLLWTRYKYKPALFVAIYCSLFYFDRIFLSGRRAVASELFFIVILALFFGAKVIMPRIVMYAIMVSMIFIMYSTGSYRNLALEGGWDAPFRAREIDFFSNVIGVYNNGGEELKNAIYAIESSDHFGAFDYGVTHWNRVISNYVPAQIFGKNFKETMLLEQKDYAGKLFNYRASTGSTVTGIADSFCSFWYFGAFIFFIIGFILRKIWINCLAESIPFQIIYMVFITKAMHAVTHHTHWFFSPWIHMALFLFPLLLWARKSSNVII